MSNKMNVMILYVHNKQRFPLHPATRPRMARSIMIRPIAMSPQPQPVTSMPLNASFNSDGQMPAPITPAVMRRSTKDEGERPENPTTFLQRLRFFFIRNTLPQLGDGNTG